MNFHLFYIQKNQTTCDERRKLNFKAMETAKLFDLIANNSKADITKLEYEDVSIGVFTGKPNHIVDNIVS